MAAVNQYTLFEYLFEYYNHALFQGQLKNCFIGVEPKKTYSKVYGKQNFAYYRGQKTKNPRSSAKSVAH